MGRTYQFECPVCHYRAQVSGGADSGIHCEVQTVVCRDCRELFDVFTKLRGCAGTKEKIRFPGFFRAEIPPVILRDGTVGMSVWRELKPACPVRRKHFVEPWTDPGRCPRCGNFMEMHGFPIKIWD